MGEESVSYVVSGATIFIYTVRHDGRIVDSRGGCTPEDLYEFYFDSIDEAITYTCETCCARKSDAKIDSTPAYYRSSIIVRSLRDRDYNIATKEEIDKWKRGEIDLYLHELSFSVNKVLEVEASDLKELGMEEDTMSKEKWLKSL